MKILICTFGRFNPITNAHEFLFNEMKEFEIEGNIDRKIYISNTVDVNKNPLPVDIKKKFIQQVTDIEVINDILIKDPYKLIESTNNIYDKVIFFCGSDRHDNYVTLQNYTNAEVIIKSYNRDKISALYQKYDISASKLRKLIKEKKYNEAENYIPTILKSKNYINTIGKYINESYSN